MQSCMLCPRGCHADRSVQPGYCGSGAAMRIARADLHFYEEPPISGRSGSGTVFFTGCGLRCLYCQNYEISFTAASGHEVSPEELREIFCRLIDRGAHNINLVTGTQYLDQILPVLASEKWPVPLIWNTGGYETVESLRRLDGLIDIYLPDYKYAEPELAARLSAAPDYPETALLAISEMLRQTGPPVLGEDGLMKKGTLVRHLILPGHTRNSILALRQLKEHFGDRLFVSLLAQYIPCGRASEFPELSRKITKREYDKVCETLFSLGIDGFVQEREAADPSYIPPFETKTG